MADPALHILIAEDDLHQRSFLERLCREAGHRVTAVTDGDACLAELARGRFDLLLLDLIMPGTDGVGVLRAMRSGPPRALPRVVVISSQDDEDAIGETLQLGASAYLTKPVSAETILQVLSQIALRATLSGLR